MPSMKFRTALAIAGFACAASIVEAGSCPKDQVLTAPRDIEKVAAEGLLREVLGNVRLEGWRDLGGFLLRMRRITVAPGGFVPTHGHSDRPTIIYIIEGEIIEHNTECAVPIVHKVGESTTEFGPTYNAWWENKGDTPVVLISTDVLPYDGDAEPYVGIEK